MFLKHTAHRAKQHRDSLRSAGLRPMLIWVPDVSSPGFAREVRRQSLMLRSDPHEAEILDVIEKVTVLDDWV